MIVEDFNVLGFSVPQWTFFHLHRSLRQLEVLTVPAPELWNLNQCLDGWSSKISC